MIAGGNARASLDGHEVAVRVRAQGMSIGQVRLPAWPLTQRLPKRLIAGGLSLSRCTLGEDTVLLSTEPLSIKMPPQQWAYGIVFPLDLPLAARLRFRASSVLRRRGDDKTHVARIKLTVEDGIVGVAATNADGSSFIAPERFVGGSAEALIALDSLTKTGGIVVREATGAKNVRVTVHEIGLFEAGEEGLAPRRHDLGYDLFVILTAPKTGSQTIEDAMYALSPFVRVHRVDHASAESARVSREQASSAAASLGADHEIVRYCKLEAEISDRVRADIATVRRFGGRIAFLTAVREPIARAVANMFESLPVTIPVYPHLYAASGPVFAQMLADGLVAAWEREFREDLPIAVRDVLWSRCLINADFFKDEIGVVTGFDRLSKDFDPDIGYARLEKGNDVAMVFRTSHLDRALSKGLAALTGRRPEAFTDRNVAAQKDYAALYQDVVSRIHLPVQLAEAIYWRHAYTRHFFTQAEIEDLIQRWSGEAPQGVTRADRALTHRERVDE